MVLLTPHLGGPSGLQLQPLPWSPSAGCGPNRGLDGVWPTGAGSRTESTCTSLLPPVQPCPSAGFPRNPSFPTPLPCCSQSGFCVFGSEEPSRGGQSLARERRARQNSGQGPRRAGSICHQPLGPRPDSERLWSCGNDLCVFSVERARPPSVPRAPRFSGWTWEWTGPWPLPWRPSQGRAWFTQASQRSTRPAGRRAQRPRRSPPATPPLPASLLLSACTPPGGEGTPEEGPGWLSWVGARPEQEGW